METTDDCDADYDVIYESSPVYESMMQAGLSSLGASDVLSRLGSESSDRRAGAKPLCLKVVFIEQATAVCVRLWATIKRTAIFFTPNHKDASMLPASRTLFNKLSTSPLLSEEDGFFLQSFQDNAAEEIKDQQTSWRLPLSLLLVVLSTLVLNAAGLSESLCPWFLQVFNTAAALTSAVIMPAVVKMVFLKQTQAQHKEFMQTLQNFLDTGEQSLDTVSRSIRFIQEAELVARGFTFVGNINISRVLCEHQKLPYIRQCPDLQQEVFFTAKAQFLLFRQSFRQLVESCPVKIEVAGVTHYCSEIPLSQYPEILQINPTDSDAVTKLQEMTSGFSIDILKSMVELNRIHVSEFIRRLAVCFLPGSTSALGNKYPFSVWKSVLQAMTCELKAGQAKLQSLLDAHRRGPLSSAFRDVKLVGQQTAEPCNLSPGAYLAVHSLELHLLAALKRVQNVGQAMEAEQEQRKSRRNQDVSADGQLQEENSRNEWSNLLHLVRSELNACVGCCEEATKRLEMKTSSDTAGNASVPRSAPGPDAGGTPAVKKVIKLSAEDAPVILDEVFEGFSEEQDAGPKKTNLDLLSTEEEAGLKQQQKNIKMCLQELDAIIAVRAAERVQRERAALERMRPLQLSSSSSAAVPLQQQPTDMTLSAAIATSEGDNCNMLQRCTESGSGRDGSSDPDEDVDGEEMSAVLSAASAGRGQTADAVDANSRGYDHTCVESQKAVCPRREESEGACYVSHATSDRVDLASEEGDGCRGSTSAPSSREPETIGEYLSLPCAPSPYVSDLAAMVASRASTLRRTVETFGDASSSDEVSEDENNSDCKVGS